jgi:hypothetical protein
MLPLSTISDLNPYIIALSSSSYEKAYKSAYIVECIGGVAITLEQIRTVTEARKRHQLKTIT